MDAAAQYSAFLQRCQAEAIAHQRRVAVELGAGDFGRALRTARRDAAVLHRRPPSEADGVGLISVHVAECLATQSSAALSLVRLALDDHGLIWTTTGAPARHPVLLDGPLLLDPPRPDDAPAWAAAQDDECARWFDWPARPSVERCRSYLAGLERDDPDTFVWAIRARGALLGGIDLRRRGGRWNAAYFVHPAHRGRAVASRALRLVTDWAFAALALDYCYGLTAPAAAESARGRRS